MLLTPRDRLLRMDAMNERSDISSIRFDSNITDEQLKEFLAHCEIIRVERRSWMSEVYLYSDEPSETLGKKLQDQFERWRIEESKRREIENVARYDAWVEKYCNGIGIRGTMTVRDGANVQGYYVVDLETSESNFQPLKPESDTPAEGC